MVDSSQQNIQTKQFQIEVEAELYSILDYWMKFTVDDLHGGFYGSINNQNIPDVNAEKGIVLNSRICWSFSAAYSITKMPAHFAMAQRAFQYIFDYFIDREYGGVYWSVDVNGKMLQGKKQIYGLAFCVYALSEFYKISNNKAALHVALDLYNYIEEKSFDKEKNGYIEAFTREWNEAVDLRLSAKDNNDRKTANTHLHIIEAYANLYTVWPKPELKERIVNLLHLFSKYFINQEHHLNLFFNDVWEPRSLLQSYGHDVEAAWLLLQCAETVGSAVDEFKTHAIALTNAAAKGLDEDGGLWYEYDPATNHLIAEKHSWPQAEAMIGFYNAYQLTGIQAYQTKSKESWNFIKTYIKDDINGEWFWGVNKNYQPMAKEKAGFWKCPYHNTRALLELMQRINITSD